MNEINKLLDAGILPDELNYTNQKNFDGVDIAKLKYNAFYRTYEYYLNKFPPGFDGLPGFDRVIKSIQEQNADNTPLKEITEIKSSAILDNVSGNVSDSSIISTSK